MKKPAPSAACAIGAIFILSGCASNPRKIEAAYVSPVKYESYSCDQLAAERLAVEARADTLYRSLDKRADTDALVMGAGAVLFLPALVFLRGDGTKAAEFSRLKGEYHALRLNAESRGCDIPFRELYKTASIDPLRDVLPAGMSEDVSVTR